MPHPTTARVTVYRCPITSQLQAEVGHDADGAECWRVEYDETSGSPYWMNVRGDLLDGQDPAMEAMYRDMLDSR